MPRELFALSVKQPWAQLFFQPNGKDIENRTWRSKYRGVLLIHASMQMDHAALRLMLSQGYRFPDPLPQGGYIGAVLMTDCLSYQECRSTWANPGGFCFCFQDRRPFPKLIEGKGCLHIFRVPDFVNVELDRIHFALPGEKPWKSPNGKPKPSSSVPCSPSA